MIHTIHPYVGFGLYFEFEIDLLNSSDVEENVDTQFNDNVNPTMISVCQGY